jgi:hypothetical protein
MRSLFICICVVIGAVVAYYAQPYVHDNADVVLIVTTIFTVFAGFLVAIITILGDPSLVPGGDWKIAENRRKNIESTLMWHNYLFAMYLITLALIFSSAVIKNVPVAIIPEIVKVWIDRGYLFFGASSFMLSFALPFALQRIQMRRLDHEIDRRRREAGIKDD